MRQWTCGDIRRDAASFGTRGALVIALTATACDGKHDADISSMTDCLRARHARVVSQPPSFEKAALRRGWTIRRFHISARNAVTVLATRSDNAASDAYRRATKRSRLSMMPARTRKDAPESCTGGTSHRPRRSVASSAGASVLRRCPAPQLQQIRESPEEAMARVLGGRARARVVGA